MKSGKNIHKLHAKGLLSDDMANACFDRMNKRLKSQVERGEKIIETLLEKSTEDIKHSFRLALSGR